MVRITTRKWEPTSRNLAVLAAVCATGSRKDAAAALGISVRVVEHHMRLLRVGSHAVSDSQLCLLHHDAIAALIEHP